MGLVIKQNKKKNPTITTTTTNEVNELRHKTDNRWQQTAETAVWFGVGLMIVLPKRSSQVCNCKQQRRNKRCKANITELVNVATSLLLFIFLLC